MGCVGWQEALEHEGSLLTSSAKSEQRRWSEATKARLDQRKDSLMKMLVVAELGDAFSGRPLQTG